MYALRLDLTKETKTREESEDDLNAKITEKITAVNEVLAHEIENEKQQAQSARQIIANEFARFMDLIDAETKQREKKNAVLQKNLEDFRNKFQEEIKQERKSREETEEQLIRVLESSCERFEREFN